MKLGCETCLNTDLKLVITQSSIPRAYLLECESSSTLSMGKDFLQITGLYIYMYMYSALQRGSIGSTEIKHL